MKKKIQDFVKSIGGTVSIAGKQWPTVAYLDHPKGKDWIVTECTKHFTRHTQFKFQ